MSMTVGVLYCAGRIGILLRYKSGIWVIGHFMLVFIPMKLDIVWFHRYFIFFLKRKGWTK